MNIVLDASIAVKWFNIKDEDNVEIALEIQGQKMLDKLEIIVPDLFFLEILNAFITKSNFSIDEVFIIEEALYKMNLIVVFPDHNILKNAIKIAYDCNLTIYDSLYLEVAKVYDALLLTEDKKILSYKNAFDLIRSLDEFKTFL